MSKATRYHGLDFLRATALILGLFYHASIPFAVDSLPVWITYEKQREWAFDFIMVTIHSFRMPLFYLLAGFFSALLYAKLDQMAFLINRIKRIVIPFILALLLITPIMIIEYLWVGYPLNPDVQDGIFSISTYPIFHLWFLEVLIIITGLIVIFITGFNSLSLSSFKKNSSRFTNFVNSKLMVWVSYVSCSVLLTLLSWTEFPGNQFIDDYDLKQPIGKVLFYFVFFSIGWILYGNKHYFRILRGSHSFNMSIGMLGMLGLVAIRYYLYTYDSQSIFLIAIGNICVVVAAVHISLGAFGYFTSEKFASSPLIDYLVRTSYWIYLVHLPIMLALQQFGASWTTNNWIKYFAIVLLTFILSATSYSIASPIRNLISGKGRQK